MQKGYYLAHNKASSHCGAKWAQIAKLRAYVGISL